jgi:hypothetical protein
MLVVDSVPGCIFDDGQIAPPLLLLELDENARRAIRSTGVLHVVSSLQRRLGSTIKF